MEKYNDYTSILKQFDEKMEKFNIEGQELSSINTAIRALKDKNIPLMIRKNESAFENLVHDHNYSDVTSSDRISQDANELNTSVNSLNAEYDDLSNIKSILISKEYTIEDNKKIVDQIVENVNGALQAIEVSREKSQDVLDNNFDKYTSNNEVEEKEVVEEVKEDKSLEDINASIEEFDIKKDDEAEKVEEVEDANKEDFHFEDINLDELNKSLEESLKDEEFHDQKIITDSLEDNKEEEKEQSSEANIEDLTALFNDDELDKELEKVSKDKEDLEESKKELDNLLYFPGVEEDKLPVIEDEDDFDLGKVSNDYKEIPKDFVKVVAVESTDSLQQAEEDERTLGRVA